MPRAGEAARLEMLSLERYAAAGERKSGHYHQELGLRRGEAVSFQQEFDLELESTPETPEKRHQPSKKAKGKTGRPLSFTGDINSPDLTEAERKKIKRRVSNRESAQRVRNRRLEATAQLEKKIDRLEKYLREGCKELEASKMEEHHYRSKLALDKQSLTEAQEVGKRLREEIRYIEESLQNALAPGGNMPCERATEQMSPALAGGFMPPARGGSRNAFPAQGPAFPQGLSPAARDALHNAFSAHAQAAPQAELLEMKQCDSDSMELEALHLLSSGDFDRDMPGRNPMTLNLAAYETPAISPLPSMDFGSLPQGMIPMEMGQIL